MALEYARSREAAGRLRMPLGKSSGAFGFIGHKKAPGNKPGALQREVMTRL
jgi:hypothetical protein